MNKIILILIISFLMSNVSAVDELGFTDDLCNGNDDCTAGKPYCWTSDKNDGMECHTSQARRGYKCPSGDDFACLGNLVCSLIPKQGFVCSECRAAQRSSGGVDYQISEGEVDRRSQSDKPYDERCIDPNIDCTCTTHDSNGNPRSYGEWNAEDNLCDPCYNDDECQSGRCALIDDNSISRCLDIDDIIVRDWCCSTGDCYSGDSCVTKHTVFYEDRERDAGECVNLRVETTTSTSITTTTTTLVATTTTTLAAGIADTCQYQIAITAAADDGYEQYQAGEDGTDEGDWIGDGSLILYNSSFERNRTYALTFRDFQLPRNVTAITSSKLWARIKSGGADNYNIKTENTLGAKTINLDDLDNTTKPSQISNFSSIDRFTESFDGTLYSMSASATAADAAQAYVAPGDDNWILIPNDLKETVHLNNGTLKPGSNITILSKPQDVSANDIYFYSFEDGAASAATLCINFTSQSFQTTFEDDSCSTDDDCNIDEFCRTGVLTNGYCLEKHGDYIEDPDNICYRNHECITGSCSGHEQNLQDYPPKNDLVGFPYNNDGVCLPLPFDMKVKIIPQTVGYSDSFNVLGSVSHNDAPLQLSNCWIQFERVERDKTDAWAYVGNKNGSLDQHFMSYQGQTTWNYVADNEFKVRGSIDEGIYKYFFICQEVTGFPVGTKGEIQVRQNNVTTINILDRLDPYMNLGDTFNVRIQHLNITEKPISGSTCLAEFEDSNATLNEVQTPTSESKYSNELTTTQVGWQYLKFFCDTTGYEQGFRRFQYFVAADHCDDGVINFGEEGLDCGGADCVSCDIDPDKKDINEPCESHEDCISGWCHPEDKICNMPTCYDGFWNNGEVQTDCGGNLCDPCPLCLINDDCSFDGSQICNNTILQCQYNNCTVSTDCEIYEFENIDRELECDTTVNLCKFYFDQPGNQTVKALGMNIKPISGNTVNKSGTILYVSNCEDENNGFKITTKDKTKLYYTFNSQTLTPSLESYPYKLLFGEDTYTKSKTALIPELCTPNAKAFGGFDKDANITYARITFTSTDGKLKHERTIDVVNFRNNFETILEIQNPEEGGDLVDTFLVRATERDVFMYAKGEPKGAWRNVTTSYQTLILYDASLDTLPDMWTNHFYYRINSSFGEVSEGTGGDLVDSIFFMKYNRDTNTVDVNLPFAIGGWAVWIIIAVCIFITAFMLYQVRRRQGGE